MKSLPISIIADCRLRIADFDFRSDRFLNQQSAIGNHFNRQSAIGNRQCLYVAA
jgi:hypothetical protein